MWPLVFVGIGVIAFAAGRSRSIVKIGESRDYVGHVAPRGYLAESPPQCRQLPITPLNKLRWMIKKGIEPDEWTAIEAAKQAYDEGRLELAIEIMNAFEKRLKPKTSAKASEAPAPKASPPLASDAPASGEVPPAQQVPEPRSYQSPIEGVDDDDWSAFANAMRIHPPEFETDRHIGAFHQRKDRLKQLSLSPGKDESAQYDAFVADCLDHVAQKKIIDKYVNSIVKIGDEDYVVTPSGMLGLMKAAGAKNAIQWIEEDQDRMKFPKTTEIFRRCNNCF